jgi:hypothetical protein
MAKPTVSPKKQTQTSPKTVEKTVKTKQVISPETQKGKSLPVIAPLQQTLVRLRQHLTRLGIEFSPTEKQAVLEAKLNKALEAQVREAAARLATDPLDCFGKATVRDPKDPDCKRCADFAQCGVAVDKLLTTAKAHVLAEAEAEAEEEAAAVVEKKLPIPAPTAPAAPVVKAGTVRALKFTEVEYREDVEITYKQASVTMSFFQNDVPTREYPEDMAEMLCKLWEKKPRAFPALVAALMKIMPGVSKSDAKEFGVSMVTDLVEDGLIVLRVQEKA